MKRAFSLIVSLLLCLSLGAGPAQQMLLAIHAASGGTTVTAVDTFVRAGTNPLDSPMSDGVSTWDSDGVGATGGVQSLFSTVFAIGGGLGMGRVATPTFPADQFSEISIANFSAPVGAMVRIQSPSDSAGYIGLVNDTTTLKIFKRTDGGSFTQLGANITVSTMIVGDLVRLSAVGTTLTIYVNGVSAATRTDSTYAAGQPGLFCQGGSIGGFSSSSIP